MKKKKETHLSGVLPSDTSEAFNGESAECGQHRPSSMDQLALTESLQSKNLRVRLKRRRFHVGALKSRPDYISRHILRQVLVQRVQIVLQILCRFPQPERIESVVADQASVQPFRRLGSWKPQRTVGYRFRRRRFLCWSFFLTESESGLDSGGTRPHVDEACSDEGGGCGGGGGGHCDDELRGELKSVRWDLGFWLGCYVAERGGL